jgi:hypothetical protein
MPISVQACFPVSLVSGSLDLSRVISIHWHILRNQRKSPYFLFLGLFMFCCSQTWIVELKFLYSIGKLLLAKKN